MERLEGKPEVDEKAYKEWKDRTLEECREFWRWWAKIHPQEWKDIIK